MLITTRSNTFWLLLFVSCMLLLKTIETTIACTTVACTSSTTNDNTTATNSTTSVQAHWEVLDKEVSELTCQQNRLVNVLSLLKINSTLNSEIIVMRNIHLEKITKAIKVLTQESTHLKATIYSKSIVLRNGVWEYGGGRAKSCSEYRNSTYYSTTIHGSGLYNIEPSTATGINMTVYCDMITDGGGWTLISGISNNYAGIHFHTFEDSTATSTSTFTSFHLKTAALLSLSTQVRVASDYSGTPITTFYLSNWNYSVYCTITTALRNAIQLTPTINNGDLPANCVILSGGPFTTPTHFTYGKTGDGHSIGFRMGQRFEPISGHMAPPYYGTLSFTGAPEGVSNSHNYLGVYNFLGEGERNGAVFLR